MTSPANTSDSDDEQLAKFSTRFVPPFRCPVHIIAPIAVTIMTIIGAIRSITLPLAYFPPSVGSVTLFSVNASPPDVNTSPFSAFFSCFFISPKSKPAVDTKNTIYNVSIAYRLNGIVDMNISKPDIELLAGTYELTAAAHDEIGAMMHIGAAVASII